MSGGAGDDRYIVDSSSDSITDNSSEGTDKVFSSATFTISDNVEQLILTGSSNISATGNSLNNTIIGNSGNNTLNGGDGNDSLTGGEVMSGGSGDDTYTVKSSSDLITEHLSEGTDLVKSSVTYILSDNLSLIHI